MKAKVFFPVFLVLTLVLFFLGGCGGIFRQSYKIGIDPYFFPLSFKEKQEDINMFFNELLYEVANSEEISFEKIKANWDTLFEFLKDKKYDGIVSSASPTIARLKEFTFSEVIVPTAPVLIVRQDDKSVSLDGMVGKRIGMLEGNNSIQLLQKYPMIQVQTYTSYAQILNDLVENKLNGALIEYVFALSYVKDLYAGELKIATEPLTNQGLRLITLKENKRLVDSFEKGVNLLKKNNSLNALQQKWGLSR